MPRNVSDVFKEAFFSDSTDEIGLMLMTIDHEELPDPIRVVLNTELVISRGDIFLPYFFRVNFPEERPDRVATAELSVDGVDRVIINQLKILITPPTVLLELVIASQPDVVEQDTPPLLWSSLIATATSISGTLEGPAVFNRRYPADVMSPTTAPGIFREI